MDSQNTNYKRNIFKRGIYMNIRKNNSRGITLIALIITIIILLILAGISIATLSGENGLFARAKQARKNTLEAQELENTILGSYEGTINSIIDGAREGVTLSKEQYEAIIQSITNMEQKILSLEESKAQVEKELEDTNKELESANKKIETIENSYVTKEYADALPQNSGNYTDLSWTLLATMNSRTWTKYNVNIDNYNYIAVTIANGNKFINPVIMSVNSFKKMCLNEDTGLYSKDDGLAAGIYYNSGLYLFCSDSSRKTMVYGIK